MLQTRYVLRRILASGCAVSVLAIAAPVMGQETPTATEGAATLEEVVVTGSRIRRSPLESPQPVLTMGAEDIEKTGQVSVGEFLQRLAISGSAINRNNNSSGNLGFPPDGSGIGAGAQEIDLRYLTSKRTLVLIDGRRWIKGSSASGVSGAVDLNTIPVNIIDRIEVLQDGASTIYGSDAIGGVVNIITSEDYDGFKASAHGGTYFDDGDGTNQEYTLRWGATGAKTRVLLAASYTDQDDVMAGDRKISQFPIAGVSDGSGGSSGTPQGRFIFTDPRTGETLSLTLNDGVLNDGGANIPEFDPLDPTGGDFHAFGTADRFNFQPFNFLTTPNERVNVFGKAEVDLMEDIVFGMTAAFTNRRSVNQAAPVPLFLGSDAGSGFFLDNVFIPADQPFNPFGIDLDGRDNLILIGRRPLEVGPRIFKQDVETWTVGGTLEGKLELFEHPVFWDVNVSWSQNEASQRFLNNINARRLALALGPADQCLAQPGCVPFNIFGGQGPDGSGSITPEMLDFVAFTQQDESRQRLFDVSFNVTGNLFELPAGPLGYAFGYEHRKETGFFQPDAAVVAGETADVPAAPTSGGFNVDEVYGEINVPLLADLQWVNLLEVNGSFRFSDYNTSGSETVFKAGGDWRPTSDLLIRGTYSEGFRAPGIGELFNTGSRFDATITDPCSNATGQTLQNCQALGVPASFVQINPQISVQTGGNPALDPETSDSWTVGFAYSPSWIEGVAGIESAIVEFNYYDIELTDAIQAIDAEEQLSQCVATLDPALCSGIVRGPGGSIIQFANQLTNIGRIETSGIDWSLTAQTEEFNFGQFRLAWHNTYLDSYKEFLPGPGGALVGVQRAGTELGSPERGFVEYKSSLVLDWLFRGFTTSLNLRYLSSIDEVCGGSLFDFGQEALCSDPGPSSADPGTNEIDDRLYTDVQVAWTPKFFDDHVTVAVGVINLFETSTPLCFSCDLNSFDGTVYPIPGRSGYLRASLQY